MPRTNRLPLSLLRPACVSAVLASALLAHAAQADRSRRPASPRSPAHAPLSPTAASQSPPTCSGEYADDLGALSARAREIEIEQARGAYTFCVRTTAVYECPFYAPDGSLRKTRRTVTAHGTAFAYRQQAGDTLLLTNEHLAEWPPVTDDERQVGDVPRGCKRVSDAVRIVDDETDGYGRDDIQLGRVVVDPQLDVAVLRAHQALPVMPWKVGRSAALRERNAVEVRGFPLGVLRARNAGKVVSAYDHDEERDWDHDDFVVDALLSPGNSGSPVLAVSCRTGEFELVGIYHAGYSRGAALNVVVGIDQVRDLMTTLKRSPRPPRPDPAAVLDASSRATLAAAVRGDLAPYFPFGGLVAAAHPRADGAIVFEVLPRDFPVRTGPLLVLEDLPAPGAFGAQGRLWAGNGDGLRLIPRPDLDAEAQAIVARLLDGLRHDALSVAELRRVARHGGRTRESFRIKVRLEKALQRAAATRADLVQVATDLAERLYPGSAESSATLAEALAPAPAHAPPVALDAAARPTGAGPGADPPAARAGGGGP